MKPEATKEDFVNREKYLIRYLNSQVEKMNRTLEKWHCEKTKGKRNAYQDILFKLTKDNL